MQSVLFLPICSKNLIKSIVLIMKKSIDVNFSPFHLQDSNFEMRFLDWIDILFWKWIISLSSPSKFLISSPNFVWEFETFIYSNIMDIQCFHFTFSFFFFRRAVMPTIMFYYKKITVLISLRNHFKKQKLKNMINGY